MNCDPLARYYRWLEYAAMGRALEWRRFEFLPKMAAARRVLILGEGDGRFLAGLLTVNGLAEIDVVDSSAKMLAAARKRMGSGQVRFHHADARVWEPPRGACYDLIVTHFFLDCFSDEDLAALVPRLSAVCTGSCRWVISEFRQPERGPGAWRARWWIGGLYRLFGWTTGLDVRRLPDYAPILEQNGFRRTACVVAEMGLLTSELWERAAIFAFDAPADVPLHSRTPKVIGAGSRRTAYVGMTRPRRKVGTAVPAQAFFYVYGRSTRLRPHHPALDPQVPHRADPFAVDLPQRPRPRGCPDVRAKPGVGRGVRRHRDLAGRPQPAPPRDAGTHPPVYPPASRARRKRQQGALPDPRVQRTGRPVRAHHETPWATSSHERTSARGRSGIPTATTSSTPPGP